MTDLIDWKTATTGELIRNACWVKGMEGVLPANDAGHEIKHRLDAYYELAAKPDLAPLRELADRIRHVALDIYIGREATQIARIVEGLDELTDAIAQVEARQAPVVDDAMLERANVAYNLSTARDSKGRVHDALTAALWRVVDGPIAAKNTARVEEELTDAIAAREQPAQGAVAWMHSEKPFAVISNQVRDLHVAAKSQHVKNYTIPLYAQPQPAVPDVSAIVNRFLSWKLPKDFAPDMGISFTPIEVMPGWNPEHCWPTGTNLFHATQAKAMIEYMLAPKPEPTP